MNASFDLDALAEAALDLERAGIENPRREARLLFDLAGGDRARFKTYLARRSRREPYSRIRGRREFWSLDLNLSPDTLDPRPDSETLVDAALEFLPGRAAPFRVLDFGSGSGALLLAFLAEFPNASGLGIDILPGAIETARANAHELGLSPRAQFAPGDWSQGNPGGARHAADVILSNPPYIPSGELETLQPEVRRFDPRAALDGGFDGLDAYRQLAPVFRHALNPGGFAFVELGLGQAGRVASIMAGCGLDIVGTRQDLARIERCLVLRQGA
jgi:release factor glutamine methyltransferase